MASVRSPGIHSKLRDKLNAKGLRPLRLRSRDPQIVTRRHVTLLSPLAAIFCYISRNYCNVRTFADVTIAVNGAGPLVGRSVDDSTDRPRGSMTIIEDFCFLLDFWLSLNNEITRIKPQ